MKKILCICLFLFGCTTINKVLNYCTQNPGVCTVVTPTNTAIPVVATSTVVPIATVTPTPVIIITKYNPAIPPITMQTSGAAANNPGETTFEVSITQHYDIRAWLQNATSALVEDEFPAGNISFINPPGAKNCDGCNHDPGVQNCGGHNTDPFGNKSVLWWVCGGSTKFNLEPRDYDVARKDQPFIVSWNGNFGCTYPNGNDYYTVKCVGNGPGSVTVCVPDGASTNSSPVVIPPVEVKCGTWPVQ